MQIQQIIAVKKIMLQATFQEKGKHNEPLTHADKEKLAVFGGAVLEKTGWIACYPYEMGGKY